MDGGNFEFLLCHTIWCVLMLVLRWRILLFDMEIPFSLSDINKLSKHNRNLLFFGESNE